MTTIFSCARLGHGFGLFSHTVHLLRDSDIACEVGSTKIDGLIHYNIFFIR